MKHKKNYKGKVTASPSNLGLPTYAGPGSIMDTASHMFQYVDQPISSLNCPQHNFEPIPKDFILTNLPAMNHNNVP